MIPSPWEIGWPWLALRALAPAAGGADVDHAGVADRVDHVVRLADEIDAVVPCGEPVGVLQDRIHGDGELAAAELLVVPRPASDLSPAGPRSRELLVTAPDRLADDRLRALRTDPAALVGREDRVLEQTEEVAGLDRGQRGRLGELVVHRCGDVDAAHLEALADGAVEVGDVAALHRRVDDDEVAVGDGVLGGLSLDCVNGHGGFVSDRERGWVGVRRPDASRDRFGESSEGQARRWIEHPRRVRGGRHPAWGAASPGAGRASTPGPSCGRHDADRSVDAALRARCCSRARERRDPPDGVADLDAPPFIAAVGG